MNEDVQSRIAKSPQYKTRALRLYNILFPAWMFYLLPTSLWLIILPANLAIDSLVLFLALKRQGIDGMRGIWKRSILRIWGLGFLADLIGAALTFGLFLLIDVARLPWDIYLFPGTPLLAMPGVVLSGILIYTLDKRYAFANCTLNETRKHNLSLALAIFTAPYAMLIPLYG